MMKKRYKQLRRLMLIFIFWDRYRLLYTQNIILIFPSGQTLGQSHVKNFPHLEVKMGGVGGVYAPPTPPKNLVLRDCTVNHPLYAIALGQTHRNNISHFDLKMGAVCVAVLKAAIGQKLLE
jgi:hypothetical protein